MEKKLTRSSNDIMFAGVASGLAEYLDMDPVIIRLIFVLLAVAGGHGLLIYFILWLLMPEDDVAEKINIVS